MAAAAARVTALRRLMSQVLSVDEWMMVAINTDVV